jgi:hypothetical protein
VAVKREQRGFVATLLQPREHVMGRKPGGEHAVGDPHAAADIEENRQTDGGGVGAEIGDPTLLAVVEYLEVFLVQSPDQPSPPIPHCCCHAHEINPGLENGLLLGWLSVRCPRRLSRGRLS